jgi:hypothetical protein
VRQDLCAMDVEEAVTMRHDTSAWAADGSRTLETMWISAWNA